MGNQNTTGNTAALANANKAFDQYNQDYGTWKGQYDQYRQQADQSWNKDFGGSAADFTKKANQSGIQAANQQLDQEARAATNQAQLASRTAGLTKGQAAMNAAGVANQTYQNNYANAVQQGQQNYGNAVNMNAANAQNRMSNSAGLMGQAQSGMQGAMGVQQGVGATQKTGSDQIMSLLGTAGGAAAGIATAMSDANAKEDIEGTDWQGDFMKRLVALSDERIKEPIPEDKDMLAEVAENIGNYTYHYKPGVGEDPSIEYSGPMAQELLQVDGYRSAVLEGPDGILRVDPSRLALTNAGMIADLSKRLLFMENLIKQVMEGLQAPPEPAPDVE